MVLIDWLNFGEITMLCQIHQTSFVKFPDKWYALLSVKQYSQML